MKGKALVFALAFLSATSAWAGYRVEGNTTKDWPEVAGKIAVAPSVCPPNFDCAWLNKVVSNYFRERTKLGTVDEPVVAQALFDIGAEQLTEENSAQIAETLGVQSFVQAIVGSSEVKSTGAIATQVGRSVIMTPTSVGQGSFELRVISADGKLLAKATGFGESGWRTGRRLIGILLDKTFERLYPEE